MSFQPKLALLGRPSQMVGAYHPRKVNMNQEQLNRIEAKLDLLLQAILEVDEDDVDSLVDLNGNTYGGGARDETQPL